MSAHRPRVDTCERPLAAAPFKSYRARGRYGWVMIGALDAADAMREARRSTDDPRELHVWDAALSLYVPCTPPTGRWLP